MSRNNFGRQFIAVDGRGQETRAGRLKPRCESVKSGQRCAYTADHDGYHCDKNGFSTWTEGDRPPRDAVSP